MMDVSWTCRQGLGPVTVVTRSSTPPPELWSPSDEIGIRVEQVFVARHDSPMPEADFLAEYRRLHAHNFPPAHLRVSSVHHFVHLCPSVIALSSGLGGTLVHLTKDRELGLLAQQILYLFLKYPNMTFTRAKFGHTFENAFGRYLDAGEVVSMFGGLVEWVESGWREGEELSLKDGVAWSLRARYLLLYEDKPMPVPNFARAYKGKYGDEVMSVALGMGLGSVEELISQHPHILLLQPTGVMINPVFLASLGREKTDIIFPPTAAPLVSPPNNAALRRRPFSVSLPQTPPPDAPTFSPQAATLMDAYWAEANPMAACLNRRLEERLALRRGAAPLPRLPPTPPAATMSTYFSAQKALQSSIAATSLRELEAVTNEMNESAEPLHAFASRLPHNFTFAS